VIHYDTAIMSLLYVFAGEGQISTSPNLYSSLYHQLMTERKPSSTFISGKVEHCVSSVI